MAIYLIFPCVFLFGALFGQLMADSGATTGIAKGIVEMLEVGRQFSQ